MDLLCAHSHGDIHYPFNPLYSDGVPIHIDTLSIGLPIVHFKESQVFFLKFDALLSLRIVLIIANNVDPDEMQHHAAFHLGLHYLQKVHV